MLVTDASIELVGESAFESCIKLARFDASSKSIGKNAFKGCWDLSDFNWLPLQSLAESAFEHSGLKKVYLPEAIDTIPQKCFTCCTKLNKLFLNKVKRVEREAFMMTDLSVLNLPISLEGIGAWSFGNCFRLANIICESPIPPIIMATSFANDPIQNIWFFSEEQKERYLKNKQWQKLSDKMRGTTPKALESYLKIEAEKEQWLLNGSK